MRETSDRELKKGTADLLALALLGERERHGYELSKQIRQRSGEVLVFPAASIYTLLYRLEGQGLIRGRWLEKPGQRRRRFYRLTALGRPHAGAGGAPLAPLRRCGAAGDRAVAGDRMIDWKKIVREHLADSGLSAEKENEVVEELSHLLEDASRDERLDAGLARSRRGVPASRGPRMGDPEEEAPPAPGKHGRRGRCPGSRRRCETGARLLPVRSRHGSAGRLALGRPEPGLHRGRGVDAGARRGPEQLDLQPGELPAAPPAPGGIARRAGAGLFTGARRFHPRGADVVPGLPGRA